MRLSARRDVVGWFRSVFGVSERRAVSATGFPRSSHRYRSRRDPQVSLRIRLKELAAARVRYGYRRLHMLLRREGWEADHKCTYRLYEPKKNCRSEPERLAVDVPADTGLAGRRPAAACEVWAMDFMSDRLFDERPFARHAPRTDGGPWLALTIVDGFTREALSTAPRTNCRA